MPEVEVVAYVDTDPTALRALSQRVPAAAKIGFATLDEAIQATEPVAMLITTQLPGHGQLVQAAIDAGLHVLVEKPFVRGVDLAQQLVASAGARGVTLMVSQNYRFFPAPRVVRQIVEDGSLGDVYQVTIDFRRDSPAIPGRPARHHADGQPLLVDMSVHHFDLLRMILAREPDRISCAGMNPPWSPFAGPAVAVASIGFGETRIDYRGSWLSAGPPTPWAGEWRMEFERGNVSWTSRGDDSTLADKVVVRERGRRAAARSLPDLRTDRRGTLTEFARAVLENREPEASGRDNLGTVAFYEAAVESANRGAASVDVNTAVTGAVG